MRIVLAIALAAGCSTSFGQGDAVQLTDELSLVTSAISDDAQQALQPRGTNAQIAVDHQMWCPEAGTLHSTGDATSSAGSEGMYAFDGSTELTGCELTSGLTIGAATLTTIGTIKWSAVQEHVTIVELIYRGELTSDGASCKVDLTFNLNLGLPLPRPTPPTTVGTVCGVSIERS
jgi:hypothetical protein